MIISNPSKVFRSHYERGFTLIELLVVVFILGIIASSAIPTGSHDQDQFKLNTAVHEVANIIRFVRDEAIRTNEIHGLSIKNSTNKIIAFKAGSNPNPLTGSTTLYDPLSKISIDKKLSEMQGMDGVTFTDSNAVFDFHDGGKGDYILFDQNGLPYWKGADGIFRMLEDSTISLGYNGLSAYIILKEGYGRVVIL